jgi:glutathione S-transferase
VVGKVIKWWYGSLSAQDEAAQAAGKAEFLNAAAALSAVIARSGGPFVAGARFSLADVLVRRAGWGGGVVDRCP